MNTHPQKEAVTHYDMSRLSEVEKCEFKYLLFKMRPQATPKQIRYKQITLESMQQGMSHSEAVYRASVMIAEANNYGAD